MKRRVRTFAWLAPGVGIVVLLGGTPAADAQTSRPVDRWIERHAVPLKTADPSAPLDDLTSLRRAVGDATIVGLGESVHGTAEQTALKQRALRFLVERMGFRSIAWEEDWTMGIKINEYVLTGKGDADSLVREMSGQWRTRQVADVLRWLRAYNAGHTDKVRFVGVEYYYTRALAYDAIDAYVAKNAPDRLAELRTHRESVRPDADIEKYAAWYMDEVKDKRPYIRHARQVYDLVESLPHKPGDRAHSLALHHARQIVSFYVHASLEFNEANTYRDAHAARNLTWWRRYSGGDKIAYWGASAHTANIPKLHVTAPATGEDLRYPTAGSYLHHWYGRRYRSIGFTLDHGTAMGFGQPIPLPRPAPDWFERRFGKVGAAQFVLDLRAPAPAPVRRWLSAPATSRGLPHFGAGSTTAGGSLGQWFDVIVHRQEVTAAQPA